MTYSCSLKTVLISQLKTYQKSHCRPLPAIMNQDLKVITGNLFTKILRRKTNCFARHLLALVMVILVQEAALPDPKPYGKHITPGHISPEFITNCQPLCMEEPYLITIW